MSSIKNFFMRLVNACPYTWAGKKCVEVATRNKTVPKKYDNKEIQFRNGMKSGRDISLIGFFCPFFWFSLFAGADKSTLLLNAYHSGVVIALGLVVVLLNYFLMLRHRKNVMSK